jgi:hypothetical protein
MATVTRVTLTCDLCGGAEDVATWRFGLDGEAYEIDLCRKDGQALAGVAAGYIAKARKTTARPGHRPAQRRRGGGSRVRGATAAGGGGARRQRGIYVYGILPDDIEVAGDTPGVGEHPGPLRDVRFDGLAALVSDVDMSGWLGSPEDLRTYREILDATAAEVPVLPLRFGTILTSEDAVAEELLAARHDEFTAALERIEGCTEFQVKGSYVKDAVLGEVLSRNKRAARLRDAIEGQDPDAAREASNELDQLLNEAATAWRKRDMRTLRQVMEGVCAASVARQPAGELDAVHVAFLVDADEERDVARAVEALARDWEGRIDLQLLGPMAAYDFTGAAQPEADSDVSC